MPMFGYLFKHKNSLTEDEIKEVVQVLKDKRKEPIYTS
jgi:hypothetical protein